MKKLLKPYLGLPKQVYILIAARIVNALGLFIFPLLTLILSKKIGLSDSEVGFWMLISGVVFIPASLIGGKIADSIGRKVVIIVFESLSALIFIVCTLIEPSMIMVYLIILAGGFLGFADPGHNALISDLTTPKNRDGAFSLSYLSFNLGFAVALVVGGFLFENYLKLMFIIDAVTLIIATILIGFFIKETIGKTEEELGDDRALEKKEEGSIFKVLLARPLLLYFALISFGYNFVYAQWGFLLPLHAEENFINEGAKLYGILASLNGIIVIVFTPILTSLFIKFKNIKKIFFGGILYTVGFGMLGFISVKTAFFVSVFIFTLGEILITVSFMPFIANHTPASHRGRMSSVLPLIMGAGYTIGPYIMGKISDQFSKEESWRIVGLIMLVSTILMLVLEKMDNKKNKNIEISE